MNKVIGRCILGSVALAQCVCALPPVVEVGPAQIVPVTGEAVTAVCRLDGSRSYDPDGTITSYSWWYHSAVYSTAVVLDVALPVGVHAFWLVARDNSGSYGTGLVAVSVCRGLFHESFETNTLESWVVERGEWAVEDSTLVHTGAHADALIRYAGEGTASWSNYTCAATFVPAETGTVGCAVRVKDGSNYYQFAIHGATNCTFACVTNGVTIPLATALRAFSVTQAYTVYITATGSMFTVRSGWHNLFNRTITNTLIARGSVALLAGGGARGAFSNVFAVQRPRPIRVVPVGDSITHGRGTSPTTFSWRYPLHRLCVEADFPVDFIGTYSTGFNGDPPWTNFHGWAFDRNHQATWGIRPEQVSNAFDGYLRQYSEPGDVIMFLLGTNGSGESNAIPRAVDSHRRMIEIARRYKPHVLIILGEPFQEWDPFPAMRTAYRALADDMTRPWSPVVTVNHASGWISNPNLPGTHTVDWVHPNPTGDFRLASLWLWPLTHWASHALYEAPAPQSPSVIINNGDAYTENPTVTVAFAAINPTPDCMLVSTVSNFAGAVWEDYTTNRTMIFSPTLGTKTVYARFNAGGPSSSASASIELVPEPLCACVLVLALFTRCQARKEYFAHLQKTQFQRGKRL